MPFGPSFLNYLFFSGLTFPLSAENKSQIRLRKARVAVDFDLKTVLGGGVSRKMVHWLALADHQGAFRSCIARMTRAAGGRTVAGDDPIRPPFRA